MGVSLFPGNDQYTYEFAMWEGWPSPQYAAATEAHSAASKMTMEKIMGDENIGERINDLANEEHDLFERESRRKSTDADRERLLQLQTLLDQCWDLLRQRRAKREFGQNPDEARLRS